MYNRKLRLAKKGITKGTANGIGETMFALTTRHTKKTTGALKPHPCIPAPPPLCWRSVWSVDAPAPLPPCSISSFVLVRFHLNHGSKTSTCQNGENIEGRKQNRFVFDGRCIFKGGKHQKTTWMLEWVRQYSNPSLSGSRAIQRNPKKYAKIACERRTVICWTAQFWRISHTIPNECRYAAPSTC